MKDKKHIEVGKACAELTKTWWITIKLTCVIFPLFAGRIRRLIDALTPLVEEGEFGSDEELGLAPWQQRAQ